jgi:hypothetical protein
MTIGERFAGVAVVAVAAVGLPVGFAIQRTWTSTHTTAALTGVLLVVGIGFMAVSQALGVALHDRRTQSGPPTIHVGIPGVTGQQGYDPMYLARLQEMQSRVQERERRLYLAGFGMESGHDEAETGQFQVTRWADSGPAVSKGWEER